MDQSRRHHLLFVVLISPHARPSHSATVDDEENNREDLCQTRECGDDEGVLEAHLRDPWCDASPGWLLEMI